MSEYINIPTNPYVYINETSETNGLVKYKTYNVVFTSSRGYLLVTTDTKELNLPSVWFKPLEEFRKDQLESIGIK